MGSQVSGHVRMYEVRLKVRVGLTSQNKPVGPTKLTRKPDSCCAHRRSENGSSRDAPLVAHSRGQNRTRKTARILGESWSPALATFSFLLCQGAVRGTMAPCSDAWCVHRSTSCVGECIPIVRDSRPRSSSDDRCVSRVQVRWSSRRRHFAPVTSAAKASTRDALSCLATCRF
jgi:hypothetical protein